MTFTTYVRERGGRGGPAGTFSVTIRANGDLALAPLVARALDRPEWVRLGYDDEARVIRVQAGRSQDPENVRHRVKYPGRDAAAVVPARQFLRWIGYDSRERGALRYEAHTVTAGRPTVDVPLTDGSPAARR